MRRMVPTFWQRATRAGRRSWEAATTLSKPTAGGLAVKSMRHAIIATRGLEGPDEDYSPLASERAITPPLLPRRLSLCTSVGEANHPATRSKNLHDSRQVPGHDE